MPTNPPQATEVYLRLRARALALDPAAIELGPFGDPDAALAILMDTGYVNGVATLATLAEGTNSLYFSTGAALLGAGGHAAVRRAGRQFLAAGKRAQRLLAPTTDFPLPPVGRVRFYVVTPAGIHSAEETEENLSEQRSRLSPLFNAAHRVVTEIRRIDERADVNA